MKIIKHKKQKRFQFDKISHPRRTITNYLTTQIKLYNKSIIEITSFLFAALALYVHIYTTFIDNVLCDILHHPQKFSTKIHPHPHRIIHLYIQIYATILKLLKYSSSLLSFNSHYSR